MSRPHHPSSPGGYQRPPRATQFKPGRSGNPAGRPKGSKSLASVIQRELAAHVIVHEDGARKRITKQRAFVKQLVNKAASGDPRIMSLLLKNAGDEGEAGSGTGQEIFGGIVDKLVMDNIVKCIQQMDAPTAASDTGPDKPAESPTQPTPTFNPEQPK